MTLGNCIASLNTNISDSMLSNIWITPSSVILTIGKRWKHVSHETSGPAREASCGENTAHYVHSGIALRGRDRSVYYLFSFWHLRTKNTKSKLCLFFVVIYQVKTRFSFLHLESFCCLSLPKYKNEFEAENGKDGIYTARDRAWWSTLLCRHSQTSRRVVCTSRENWDYKVIPSAGLHRERLNLPRVLRIHKQRGRSKSFLWWYI